MMDKHNILSVGMSHHSDSLEAGQQAARMALDSMEPNVSVAWALAFCGGRHDPEAVLQGLRSEFGEVEIVGGTAVGTITNSSIGYTGYECAVTAFPSSIPQPVIVQASGLEAEEAKVGQQLGSRLYEIANEGDTVLMFYDSIRSGPPPVLNVGSQLLDGVYMGLGGKQLTIIGAGLIGDFQMSRSYVFNGRQVMKHAAVAVVLPAMLSAHTTIMHGCMPVSSFLEITRIDGPLIHEINNRPALEVLQEMIGGEQDPQDLDNLSLITTLGEKHGDLYAPYDESAYVNRLIVSANPEDGSVRLFEADFQVGTKIQVMSRNNQMMGESVQRRTRALLESLGSAKPLGAFYIDCAGRACAFGGGDVEEASILQTEMGRDIPLLGFYSGVELAPLLGRTRPLDWTGVLTVFTLENG